MTNTTKNEVLYNRYDKNYTATAYLQARLKHCIGVSTVTCYNCSCMGDTAIAVYHYNALIAVYIPYQDLFLFNYRFYDYSTCTSRVRNQFVEFYADTYNPPATATLRKIEREHKTIKGDTNSKYKVAEIENERRY